MKLCFFTDYEFTIYVQSQILLYKQDWERYFIFSSSHADSVWQLRLQTKHKLLDFIFSLRWQFDATPVPCISNHVTMHPHIDSCIDFQGSYKRSFKKEDIAMIWPSTCRFTWFLVHPNTHVANDLLWRIPGYKLLMQVAEFYQCKIQLTCLLLTHWLWPEPCEINVNPTAAGLVSIWITN